jgi:hypothetical protein
LYPILFSPMRATYTAYLILCDLIILIIFLRRVQVMKPLVMQFYPASFYPIPRTYIFDVLNLIVFTTHQVLTPF